ncbi:MAG TPA: hypothetical protein VNT60_09540 [Deinococcales bacterium]|nr:hypothetical protein [Deinococcales bacterium]
MRRLTGPQLLLLVVGGLLAFGLLSYLLGTALLAVSSGSGLEVGAVSFVAWLLVGAASFLLVMALGRRRR